MNYTRQYGIIKYYKRQFDQMCDSVNELVSLVSDQPGLREAGASKNEKYATKTPPHQPLSIICLNLLIIMEGFRITPLLEMKMAPKIKKPHDSSYK